MYINDQNLRMTVPHTDSHNTSKQIQVSSTITVPQPLHVTLDHKNNRNAEWPL